MVSLVVPAISLTIVRSFPINAFNKEDLPTFGWPIIANFGTSLTADASSESLSEISAAIASSNSPVPLPLIEDRKNICSKPRL